MLFQMMLIEGTQLELIVDEVNEEEVLKETSVTTAPNIPVYNILISLIIILIISRHSNHRMSIINNINIIIIDSPLNYVKSVAGYEVAVVIVSSLVIINDSHCFGPMFAILVYK